MFTCSNARYNRLLQAVEFIAMRSNNMAISVAKLQASVTRLETDVDALLDLTAATQTQLEQVSAQLAAAIAANDPAALKAVQDAIDGIADHLDIESAKVEAVEAATGATGATGA